MPYSLDTSGFLDAWVRHYPPDVFPPIWQQMEDAGERGVVLVSDEVLRELERKDDGAYEWLKARGQMIVPLDSNIEAAVKDLLKQHPRLLDTRKSRSGADPFVIALARLRGLTVVSAEIRSGNLQKPKIPDVCDALGIECLNLIDFFRKEGWRL